MRFINADSLIKEVGINQECALMPTQKRGIIKLIERMTTYVFTDGARGWHYTCNEDLPPEGVEVMVQLDNKEVSTAKLGRNWAGEPEWQYMYDDEQWAHYATQEVVRWGELPELQSVVDVR